MKLETTVTLTICGLLTLPACRNDEATQVPDTRTPYMEEDERALEDEEGMREEGMREDGMREDGMPDDGMRESPEGHGGEMGTEPM